MIKRLRDILEKYPDDYEQKTEIGKSFVALHKDAKKIDKLGDKGSTEGQFRADNVKVAAHNRAPQDGFPADGQDNDYNLRTFYNKADKGEDEDYVYGYDPNDADNDETRSYYANDGEYNNTEETVNEAKCTCDEGGSAGCPVHDEAARKDSEKSDMRKHIDALNMATVKHMAADKARRRKAREETEPRLTFFQLMEKWETKKKKDSDWEAIDPKDERIGDEGHKPRKAKKVKEETQLDELSSTKLGNYIKQSSKPLPKKRQRGIDQAVNRLQGWRDTKGRHPNRQTPYHLSDDDLPYKEETEQLDEAKRDKRAEYEAALDKKYAAIATPGQRGPTDPEFLAILKKHAMNRFDILNRIQRGESNPGSPYSVALKKRRETREETEQLDETLTRKHFREVANTVRAIEDPKKRAEYAQHHAAIFAKSNPRFSFEKFYAAAGTPMVVTTKTIPREKK